MTEIKHRETREEILRRGAQGDDITAEIDALDAELAGQAKSQKLSTEIAATKGRMARESAQQKLQRDHDAAHAAYTDLHAKVGIAATKADELIEQAKQAVTDWKLAVEAERTQAMQVHGLKQQGARPLPMPVAIVGTGEISLHVLRRAGEGVWQQILHDGKLPRIA